MDNSTTVHDTYHLLPFGLGAQNDGRRSLLAYAIIAVLVVVLTRAYFSQTKLPDVPMLKISKLPGAAGAAEDLARYIKNGAEVMQVGWERYSKKGQHYLMRTPGFTMLVVAPRLTEEIRSAADDTLSAVKANSEFMQFRYTLHKFMETDQYHNVVVQRQLTQNLGPSLYAIVDEAKGSFKDTLGTFKVSFPLVPTDLTMWNLSFDIVTRTANRLLFGPELAKNAEFLRLSVDFSFIMFGGADMIRTYAEILKPLVLYWKTPMHKTLNLARKHLVPVIEQRIALMQQHEAAGTMDVWKKEKPNDCIQWVLDVTPLEKRDPQMLVYRMLHINIAAVHTSSVTFLDCIYELAAHPEIHDELRQEILTTFAAEGNWSKQGLTHLHKMDSFMRECVRFNPVFSGNLDRIALKDTTLSDGTFVPKGTWVTVPSYPMYMDDDYYENAHEFDAFRFSKKREKSGQETAFSFVQTSTTYLHFGHGKHACPGRFFAANEIKILLVLTLMNYDISLPDPTKKPEPVWFTKARTPSTKGVIRWVSRPEVPDFARFE
ncbi:hypothetical protein AYO21_10607 [Fonsecaea monophora]|uniref:Cytochrome P450 n=1 Tax=Fonsecaea monophora TaxID=254056 RepID=A0A177EW84_9EURO|nr:hypothetical protein AYO21_10607 [Fonsecaea monophora]OAG35209.1 hypothetical protein AYO21_10607 [Fonsecaea monophora]